MVDAWREVPGNGAFSAKNCVEVVLNALHHSKFEPGVFPTWAQSVLADYLVDPQAVLGPGPADLAKLFFGQAWQMHQVERVRRSVNRLCETATLTYEKRRLTFGTLTGPEMQSLWCKLKGSLDDYSSQSLGRHARKAASLPQS